jgi:hypothetical protein
LMYTKSTLVASFLLIIFVITFKSIQSDFFSTIVFTGISGIFYLCVLLLIERRFLREIHLMSQPIIQHLHTKSATWKNPPCIRYKNIKKGTNCTKTIEMYIRTPCGIDLLNCGVFECRLRE